MRTDRHPAGPEPFEPTEIERQLIAEAVKAVKWPELAKLHSIIDPPPLVQTAKSEDIFEFRDEAGQITMLQVRVETDDGKEYRPLTYWTDNRWRQCEPEGLLPLWGLDGLKGHSIAFVHEGAKPARAMRHLTEDTREGRELRAKHPWGAQMDGAAHLGWIGGAPSPHRTDWSALHKAGVTTVYVVADNDDSGRSAVPKISKMLSEWSIAVRAVRFTADFPVGFDLADEFPADGEERLFGDYVDPAIWATRIGAVPDSPEGKGNASAPLPSERSPWPPCTHLRALLWVVAGAGAI